MPSGQILTIAELPDPPAGARNLMLIVLDSLRYDSWLAANPKNLSKLGEVQRRYSYATWTAPSHYNMLMGLLPHSLPAGTPTVTYVQRELTQLAENIQIDVAEFARKLVPSMYLPTFFRSLGYRTRAIVSMPVLNSHTIVGRDFESYDRMKRHNDMATMIDLIKFDPDRPTFYLLNIGETHYPYAVPGDDPSRWPHLSGVHGAVQWMGVPQPEGRVAPRLLTATEMDEARDRQINALQYVDNLFDELFAKVPENTHIIVTADHGDLFGEDGMFGHGPVIHQKVLEVPLVEGRVPNGSRL
jgi:membrane-anchored protein YejM (alkaline phosphatase superfamily)